MKDAGPGQNNAEAGRAAPAPAQKSHLASGPGLREILNGVFYNYRLILLTFFAPIVLATLFSLTLETQYPADVRLLVLLSREHMLGEGAGLGTAGFGNSFNMQQRIVKAESQVLGARELREDVVRIFGPKRLYPDIESSKSEDSQRHMIQAAAIALDRDLTIDLSSTSDIIHLHYEHPDPVLAADVLNQVVDQYLVRRQQIFAAENSNVLAGRMHELEDDLADINHKIEELRRTVDVADFEVARRELLERLANYQEARFKSLSAIRGLNARVGELELLIGLVPEEVEQFVDDGESSALSEALNRLKTLELERARLAHIYKPNSPRYQQIEERIYQAQLAVQEIREARIGRQRTGRNATHDDLMKEIITLQAQQREQEAISDKQAAGIEETQVRLLDLEAVEARHNKLMLERSILVEKIKNYAIQLEKENLATSLERQYEDPTVRIIERAVPAVEGDSRHLQVISIGVLCGIIFSIAAIYLTSIGRTIMITPEEAERTLGIPVLLSIPTKS